jgi:superoxide dismutase, Cu-Zn family
MKTTHQLTALFLGLIAISAGCSDDDEGAPTPGGGTSGSGGSGARGGAAGSGGSSGRGGASGNGGIAGSAGMSGSSGSAGTGGTSGTGGADAGDAATDGGARLSVSDGAWVVYPDPYADGGANPITATVMGTAEAFAAPSGGMRVTLSVSGLPADRMFGAHLHKLACNDNKAGGHYQNNPFPADGGSATDPTYANSTNEVWLDFHTNANGAASATATVAWRPRAGEAKAVVIHTMTTMDGGVAGAKLACTNIPF